jgi:crotonobetainyl-CoA:carnitine CoA-transferase CaiB-like acyl-CoA transferase
VNAGFVFAHDGPGVEGRAPRLGEHTDEVLAALGYSAAEIERLRCAGAISGQAPPAQ